MAYNKDAITSSTPIRQYPTLLTNNFSAIVSGDYTLTSPTISQSSVNLYKITGSPTDPETAANMGRLYTKELDSEVELYYKSDQGNITLLTDDSKTTLGTGSGSAANRGSVYLPGGLLLQWDTVTSAPGTISFPLTFSAVAYSVIIQQQGPNGTSDFFKISAITASGFTFNIDDSNNISVGGSRTFNYMAIGAA